MTRYSFEKKLWSVRCDKCGFTTTESEFYPKAIELFANGWAHIRTTYAGAYLDVCERCCKRYTIKELGE